MEYPVPKKQGKKSHWEMICYTQRNFWISFVFDTKSMRWNFHVLDKYEEDAFQMVLNVVLEMIIAALRSQLVMLFPMDSKMEILYMDWDALLQGAKKDCMPTKDAINTDPAPKTVNVVLDLFVRHMDMETWKLVRWVENTNPTHMHSELKGTKKDCMHNLGRIAKVFQIFENTSKKMK